MIPGKSMIFSDHLSRNVDNGKLNNLSCKGLDLKFHDVYLNASSEKCISLATEMSKDPVLMALKNQIIKGWPGQRSKCLRNLVKSWYYRDELSILDELILKGTHIVIPDQCKSKLMVQLLKDHFGTDQTN